MERLLKVASYTANDALQLALTGQQVLTEAAEVIMRSFFYSGALLGLSFMVACLPSRMADDDARNSGSILANIGGIDSEDLANFKPENFELICEAQGSDEKVRVKADQASAETLSFPSQNLKDGYACALEVRAEVSDQFRFTWYGVDAEGQPVAGLYYSSNKDRISERKLSLKLFKLYSRTPADYFIADFTVAFEGEDVLPDAVEIEEQREAMSLTLECGESNYRSLPAEAIEDQPRQRKFTIKDLSASKMNGVSCNELKVVIKNSELVYHAELTADQVTFSNPEIGSQVTFGPIEVKKYIPGPLDLELEAGAHCTQFDVVRRECLAFMLPRNQNFWFATLEAQDASGNARQILVSGPQGLGLDQGDRVKSLAIMNQELTAGQTSVHRFFDAERRDAILSAPISHNAIASIAPLEPAELAGLSVTKIVDVYVHGFQSYADEASAPAAAKIGQRWYTVVKAQGAEHPAEFIVSGANKYFNSNPLEGSNRFFSWDAFSSAPQNFALYTYSGAANGGELIAESCTTQLGYFQDQLSQLADNQLGAQSQLASIDSCQLPSIPEQVLNWEKTQKTYLWGWHRLTL